VSLLVQTVSNRIAGAFQGVKLMSEEMKRNQFENDWKQVQIADVVKNNEKRTAIKEVRPAPLRPSVYRLNLLMLLSPCVPWCRALPHSRRPMGLWSSFRLIQVFRKYFEQLRVIFRFYSSQVRPSSTDCWNQS
jgi:hypothetical protein